MLQLKLLLRLLAVFTLVFSVQSFANNPADAKVAGFAGADYWEVVQQGDQGRTQSQSREAGQLINIKGEEWRHWRNKWITPIGAYTLGGTLGLLVIFYLITGQNKLTHPRTGNLIERWKRIDRANHWLVAVLFIILMISGLSILYGKFFLKDVLGGSLWASYMTLSKTLHNYLGPLFALSLLFMIVRWFKHNIFNQTDLKWFLKGGGIIGKTHPSAGYLNGGEKIWYWMVTLVGLLVCVTGLVLDFQNFGQARETMQIANLLHAAGSLLLIAGSLGHMYIGSIGTEGALEGMKTGYVDESWAKQHHDLWYEEVKQKDN